MGTELSVANLSADDRRALADYWSAFEKHRVAVEGEFMEVVKRIPVFAKIIASMKPEDMEAQQKEGMARQRKALVDGDWEPYFADLRQQSVTYARLGIPFSQWFDLISATRKALLPLLLSSYGKDPKGTESALTGLHLYLDIAMAAMGDTYLHTKEQIIGAQQVAIRELSTPVLQVRDELLIVPLVGVVDTHRARQLTEDLLKAIRDRRAKMVVIDITGVPVVDSKVANHLVQTVEAAELMGATAIVTGISPEIALTLVTLGAELKGVRTMIDLQEGIAEADRLMRRPAGAAA